MDTHTQEPWGCNSKGQIHSGDFHSSDGATIICKCNNPEDARRIVACVNACAGIETEMLEIPKLLQSLVAARTNELRKENRELLEALNGLFWRIDNMMPWDRQEPLNTLMNNARAAIAKATNQAT